MHKVQRRTFKKRKDKRTGGKIRKNEGNITTSKRLTIPPNFIYSGIPPTKIQGTPSKETIEKKENYVLDSFHGLFNKCLNIRRSERILNKFTDGNASTGEEQQSDLTCPNREIDRIVNPTSSFNPVQEIHSVEFLKSRNEVKCRNNNSNKRKGKITLKKSKSIFEEINQLYARTNQYNFDNFKFDPVNNSTNESNLKYSFCNSLFQQVNERFAFGQKAILLCKSKIVTEIKKIDNLLSRNTKMEKTPKVLNNKTNNFYIDEGNNDINWKFFSQSEWVYNTPPRRKIVPPKLENSQLQPAILCNNQKQKQLFQWKSNLNMDIGDLDTKDNIVVNNNYMEHIATLNRDINIDVDMELNLNEKKSGNSNNMFNFPKTALLNTYQRTTMSNCKEFKQVKKFKHTSNNKNNLYHDMSPNYTATETKENNSSSPSLYFETKKRLFGQNSSTFNLLNNFEMNCPISLNSNGDSDFSFLKPINQESTSRLNFDFKSSTRKIQNGNVFSYASDKTGFI